MGRKVQNCCSEWCAQDERLRRRYHWSRRKYNPGSEENHYWQVSSFMLMVKPWELEKPRDMLRRVKAESPPSAPSPSASALQGDGEEQAAETPGKSLKDHRKGTAGCVPQHLSPLFLRSIRTGHQSWLGAPIRQNISKEWVLLKPRALLFVTWTGIR